MRLEFCIRCQVSECVRVVPALKKNVSIVVPYTRATIVRAKVGKEIFETVSVVGKGNLDQFPVVSLLATIATHHKTIIISQINAGDFSVIKILERTPDVRPRVDRCLRRVEFELGLR